MSDENSQTSEAPDGASELQQANDRAERMAAQRREIGAKYDQSLEKIAALEAKLAEATKAKPPADAGAAAEAPPWAAAIEGMSAKIDGLFQQFESHQASAARAAVEAKVLQQVPDGNRETVKALLGSLGVDFTKPGADADALAKLQEHHPITMVDHTRGVQLRAPQISPDGKVPASYFESFRSFAEVPDAYKQAAMRNPEVFARLMNGGGGGPRGDGLNI